MTAVADLLVDVAGFVLAIVFLLSAFAKFQDLRAFRSAVAMYRLVPPSLVRVAAFVITASELAVAISLGAGIAPEIGAAGAIGLLLIFLAAVSVNLRRGASIPCGCFGDKTNTISVRTGARILALLLVAAILESGTLTLPDRAAHLAHRQQVQVAAEVGIAMAMLVVALLITASGDILHVLRDPGRGRAGS